MEIPLCNVESEEQKDVQRALDQPVREPGSSQQIEG